MSTMEEMNNKMTIIFSKTTGKIQAILTGIQDFNVVYGAESVEFGLIWDSTILDIDTLVVQNTSNFKINIDTKTLEMIPTTVENNYPIAE